MTTHPRRAVLCCEIDLAIANRNKIWPVCFELEFGELSLRGTPYRDRHAKRLTTQKTRAADASLEVGLGACTP